MNRRSLLKRLVGAAASVAVAASIEWRAFEAPKFNPEWAQLPYSEWEPYFAKSDEQFFEGYKRYSV